MRLVLEDSKRRAYEADPRLDPPGPVSDDYIEEVVGELRKGECSAFGNIRVRGGGWMTVADVPLIAEPEEL